MRNKKAAIPAAPCIHEVPGGSSGGSWRCSVNRQRAPARSRIARSARASAIVRAAASNSGNPVELFEPTLAEARLDDH